MSEVTEWFDMGRKSGFETAAAARAAQDACVKIMGEMVRLSTSYKRRGYEAVGTWKLDAVKVDSDKHGWYVQVSHVIAVRKAAQ